MGNALLQYEDGAEDSFQQAIRGTDWFKEYVQEYGEEPDLRPASEDQTKGPNYDYRAAWAAGIRPQRHATDVNPKTGLARFHWSSANPETGDMLKTANHPTAWKESYMRDFGVDPDTIDPAEVNALRALKGY